MLISIGWLYFFCYVLCPWNRYAWYNWNLSRNNPTFKDTVLHLFSSWSLPKHTTVRRPYTPESLQQFSVQADPEPDMQEIHVENPPASEQDGSLAIYSEIGGPNTKL